MTFKQFPTLNTNIRTTNQEQTGLVIDDLAFNSGWKADMVHGGFLNVVFWEVWVGQSKRKVGFEIRLMRESGYIP